MRWKRILLWIVLVYISLILESTVFVHLTILGAKPDLLLIAVVMVGVFQGKEKATGTGFMIGLAEDFFVGHYLGINALVKAATGYLTGMVEQEVVKENIVISVSMVWIFSLFHKAAYALVMILMGQLAALGLTYLGTSLSFALYNALLAILLFPLFYTLLVKGILKNEKKDRTGDFL